MSTCVHPWLKIDILPWFLIFNFELLQFVSLVVRPWSVDSQIFLFGFHPGGSVISEDG
jgi:hypothetical protein